MSLDLDQWIIYAGDNILACKNSDPARIWETWEMED